MIDAFDAFDFFDVDEADLVPNAPAYDAFVSLNTGDLFIVGNDTRTVYRVFGPPGSMVGSATKNVVREGTAGRKFYQARLQDDAGTVGIFEYLDGGARTSAAPKGKLGPITRR